MNLSARPVSTPKKNIFKRPFSQANNITKNSQKTNTINNSQSQKESISYLKMTEDINTMLNIKAQIDNVLTLTSKVIKDNETTLDVLKILEPVVNGVKRSYPNFHKAGTQYFITFATMQESAKTNQVLSSASVRLPRESFVRDWKNFCTTIDSLTSSHPPPHSNEITAKFESIRSSLNYIKMTNENRKTPAIHLTNYINNVQSLSNNLYEQIMNLFSSPTFPNFETDLLSAYITNIKSFLGIINNAFSNEFLQSGVMFFDLARVKSNIFTDCNEIIQTLKSAFAFPVQVGSIQKLKDEVSVSINSIVEKLSIPFAIVKPSEKSVARQELQKERTKELRKMDEEIAENDFAPQIVIDQYSEAVKKVRNFLNSLYQTIEFEEVATDDVWSDLSQGMISVQKFKIQFNDQKKTIRKLELQIQNLNETDKEREILYTNRKEMFINHSDEQNNRYLKLEHEFKLLTNKCYELVKVINEKDDQINYLKNCGDPVFLKKSLREIGGAFFNCDNLSQLKTNDDQELVSRVKDIQTKYFHKKCESCQKYENMMDETIDQMNENTEINSKEFMTAFSQFVDSYKSIKSQRDSYLNEINESKSKLQKMIEKISKVNSSEGDFKQEDIRKLFTIFEAETEKLIELKNNVESSSKKKEENYLKTFQQISSKLNKLLSDKEEPLTTFSDSNSLVDIRNQLIETVSAQLRSLRDKMKETQKKEEDLTNQIDKLKQQRSEATQRLSQSIKYINTKYKEKTNLFDRDEKLFLDVIKSTEIHIKTNESTIRELQNKIQNLKNESFAINSRLLGVLKLQSNEDYQNLDENSIINSIYKNIELIQDQKENLLKNSNISEDKDSIFKNCFLSLLVLNNPNIDEKNYINDDDKLMKEVTKIVEDFVELKNNMKSNYFSFDQIEQIFKPAISLMKDPPQQKENHLVFLNYMAKSLSSSLQTLNILDKFVNDVNLAFRTFDVSLESLELNHEGFMSFKEMIHGLKSELEKIASQICSASLLTILYKFISLIIKCIDLIQLHEIL